MHEIGERGKGKTTTRVVMRVSEGKTVRQTVKQIARAGSKNTPNIGIRARERVDDW